MNIPAIGAARGIFELFVPGTFLIVNCFLVAYIILDQPGQDRMVVFTSNTALSLTILICFGYLAGVIMRLFRTDLPDELSARLIRLTSKTARKRSGQSSTDTPDEEAPPSKAKIRTNQKFESWAVEDFPYIRWTGEKHRLCSAPSDPGRKGPVEEFYDAVWAIHNESEYKKTFFNFCKTLINSVDERAAQEIYSAEALNRYLTGMFYSLVFSLILVLVGFIIEWYSGFTDAAWAVFVGFFVIYLFMLWAILRHYRISRIKEVEIVFAATYRHRGLFEPPEPEEARPVKRHPGRVLDWLAWRRGSTSE